MSRLAFLPQDGGFGMARTVAELLRAECAGLGVEGVVLDEVPAARPDQIDVVVTHGVADPLPAEIAEEEDRLARTVLLVCDRATSPHFDGLVAAAGRVGGRFAADVATADALSARWTSTDFLPLGYTEEQDAWAAAGSRDLDVVFLGPPSERRRASADAFAAAHPDLRIDGAVRSGPDATRGGFEDVAAQRAALRRARVAVLVHPEHADEGTEWFGAAEAILAGAALVLERSTDLAPLKAGRDVLIAGLPALPTVVDALLADEERIQALREGGYALLRGAPPLAAAVGQLLGRAWELRSSTWRAPALRG